MALSAAVNAAPSLKPSDRALATRLVYGTLQWRGELDHLLGQRMERRIKDADPIARRILRVAAYELRHMPNTPGHAVVNEAVGLIKELRRPKLAGFVNAVLRRLAKDRDADELALPDATEEPVGHLVAAGSLPRWLAERWLLRFGPEGALALARSLNEEPPPTIRVNTRRIGPMALAERLVDDLDVTALVSGRAPEGLIVEPFGGLVLHPSFAEGLWTVQDEASMLVARLLAPEPGERVLDACAAPGGKTCHMAALMNDQGHIDALDVHAGRANLITETAKRLGAGCVEVHVGDIQDPAITPGPYDRVLVDAPCSNLGTLRRHPEVKWRRRPDEVDRMPAVQAAILAAAADRVRPDGTLVYAVCSTEQSEGEAVVDAFLASPGAAGWREDAPRLRTWPHRDGIDGFFAARLRRP